VKALEGVKLLEAHWWTCAAGVYVGSLRLSAAPQVDQQALLRHVQALFGAYIRHLTVEINNAA